MAVGMFVAGWFFVVLYRKAMTYEPPERQCERNLRTIYVASRKLPLQDRGSMEAVRGVLSRQFLVTKQEDEYLYPEGSEHYLSYDGPRLEALLCEEDPEYGRKIGLAVSAILDFEPSYTFAPDPATVAYCPFHRLALTPDGRIKKR